MKKRFRIITSLILVTLLVTALASPAIAASGQNTVGGYPVVFEVSCDADSGYANIRCIGAPTYVKAKSYGYFYDPANRDFGYDGETSGNGYSTATATAGPRFPLIHRPDVKGYGEVQYIIGTFWVNENYTGTLKQYGANPQPGVL